MFIEKDFRYTPAECKKLGGKMVVSVQPKSHFEYLNVNPATQSYLCGGGGILLGRKDSDTL
jgi:hypothetical protein